VYTYKPDGRSGWVRRAGFQPALLEFGSGHVVGGLEARPPFVQWRPSPRFV